MNMCIFLSAFIGICIVKKVIQKEHSPRLTVAFFFQCAVRKFVPKIPLKYATKPFCSNGMVINLRQYYISSLTETGLNFV